MNIWMITADAQGSPDSMQIGVADHEVVAWDMVSAWVEPLINELNAGMDMTIPMPKKPWNGVVAPATTEVLMDWVNALKDAVEVCGWNVSVRSHDINIMKPKMT